MMTVGIPDVRTNVDEELRSLLRRRGVKLRVREFDDEFPHVLGRIAFERVTVQVDRQTWWAAKLGHCFHWGPVLAIISASRMERYLGRLPRPEHYEVSFDFCSGIE